VALSLINAGQSGWKLEEKGGVDWLMLRTLKECIKTPYLPMNWPENCLNLISDAHG
jgi:hypothetical protein